MKFFNIGVIGNGTASIISILSLINASKREKVNLKITCLHDPSIPTIEVGESTSSSILPLLINVLNFRILKDLYKIDGTIKYGTKYSNWSEKDFFVSHIDPAIHLNSKIFSKWAIEEIKNQYGNIFFEIKETVECIKNTQNNNCLVITTSNSYEFDYVIDCTGFSSNTTKEEDENIVVSDHISINSAILFPEKNSYNAEEIYTTSTAHRNGWMFEIPLTTRKTFGYLYNNKITKYEEAVLDFCKIKNLDLSFAKSLRNFSWTPFYRKKVLDSRILYCGNKLFFFEPNQAFALHYYAVIIDIFIELLNKNENNISEEINNFYIDAINSIQDVILLTYQADTKYKTNFWIESKKKSYDKLSKSQPFMDWCLNQKKYSHYSSHSNEILNTLIEGMNINLNKFKK